MSDWIAPLLDLLAQGRPVVRLAVAAVRGSAPREPGATLLYWNDARGHTHSRGSIGGGHLEARALEIAAHLLSGSPEARRVERFSLAASLGQCCGGVVELYWERFDHAAQARILAGAPLHAAPLRGCALDGSGDERLWSPAEAETLGLTLPSHPAGLVQHDGRPWFVERLVDDTLPLWLYGAGHVGRALVSVLADLPFRVTWIDSRPGMLAEAAALFSNRPIAAIEADAPEDAAADAPPGAWHLVMTHNHDEDFRVCETLLRAGTFGTLGMIGSEAKAARFKHRLLQRGLPDSAVSCLVSPIGIGQIRSKLPAAIAVSVAAQLLQWRESLCKPWSVPGLSSAPVPGATPDRVGSAGAGHLLRGASR